MRLLIVNPNTSAGVTARIAAAAEAVAGPGDSFVTRSAAFGPDLIVTDADAAEAVDGVLATVRAVRAPLDGIVLASFGDTGAAEVRAACPGLPVIGIAGAAFAAARALGGPVGIVTFSDSLVPGLRAMAGRHGLGPSLMGVAAVPGRDPGDPGTVQDRLGAEMTDLCRDMQARGAACIVLGGGPLAGLARRIGPLLRIPVIDGTQAAIGLIRAMADRAAAAAAAQPQDVTG